MIACTTVLEEAQKSVKAFQREAGLPSSENFILNWMEQAVEDAVPFPPKQLILNNPITPAWMKVLCQSLVCVNMQKYISSQMTKRYAGLTSICCWGAQFGDVGVRHIAEALPQLPLCVKLELMDCNVGVAGCEALATALRKRKTAFLKILRLDHNPNIGAAGIVALSEGLHYNSSVHTLSLAHCNLRGEGGEHVKTILSTQDIGIRALSLESNELGRVGFAAIAKGLEVNRSLTSLNLSCNKFGGELDVEVMEQFCAALMTNKACSKLNLDGNLLGEKCTKMMVDKLKDCTHITELQVSPFVDTALYATLSQRIEQNKPKKATKKKKGVRAARMTTA